VLVVREEPLLRNLARMQALCDTRGVRLRPHVKTHKSTMIAAMQRSRGTVGITVASLAEAEVFARAGHDDILAVFPPVDPVKRARFESLARTTHLTFAVDDISGVAAVESLADRTGSPVGYVWETETGTARGGTSPQDTVRSLAAARAAHPRARFAGLMSFGGHVYGAASPAAVIEEARRDSETIAETAARAAAAGIIVPHVSVGATPGAADLLSNRGVTELRAGNYVFNDATQVALGAAQVGDCAQVIVTTVTSRPACADRCGVQRPPQGSDVRSHLGFRHRRGPPRSHDHPLV
jgi:D-serine deaminase-like pyridoxal phosphate-dependent protein